MTRTRATNHTMQRMGASRLAQLQFGSARRLAPTADGGRWRIPVNINRPLFRDISGFLAGGFLAALLSGLVFIAFVPLLPPKPTDHTREALAMLVLVTFFCGGFIGRRALSADFLSQLLLSFGCSYAAMVFLCVLASLDFVEIARMIGLASAGILPSAGVLFLLCQRFPPKPQSYEL